MEQKKGGSNAGCIVMVIVLILFSFVAESCDSCLSSCHEETIHTCMKCYGKGKIKDSFGYYTITCPRCHGVGYLLY